MKFNRSVPFLQHSFFALLTVLFFAVFANGQNAAFTYQGRLNDSSATGNSYLFKFELFNQPENGALIDALSDVPATVANGVFTVELNFTAPNAFDGGERFLQIWVKRNAGETYTLLTPRQKIAAAPYAVRALKAATADDVLTVGGTPAAQIIREGDARLSDNRMPAPGSGNYIQNQNSSVQASTNFNISGTGTANAFNAATQFNINGARILSNPGFENLFAGLGAGNTNTLGGGNAFFGYFAGNINNSGQYNAFFGNNAGSQNSAGSFNSFFGTSAGYNATGSDNSFFGAESGAQTTSGNLNSFFGKYAGYTNTTGSNNTLLGANTVAADNLTFATALGAGASVAASNTLVLGRASGADTVRIPGNLNVAGTTSFNGALGASVFNAANAFQIGGTQVFSIAGDQNLFAGENAGAGNSAGIQNTFVGRRAGFANNGSYNAFFGRDAGRANTSGNANTFFGASAGAVNTTGSRNIFIGTDSADNNTTGNSNTIIGTNADVAAANLNFATAIGADAVVSSSNTIALGRISGADSVRIPGRLFVGIVPSGDRRNMQWDPDTGQLFQDTSSRRYKENIRPLAVDFRQLLKAVPQTYTRPGFPGRWEIGFIAEEMDALGLKPLVEYDKEGKPDGVNYDKIPLYLTQIAAEQEKEINRLTEENNRLKAQFEELKKLVCATQPQAELCQK